MTPETCCTSRTCRARSQIASKAAGVAFVVVALLGGAPEARAQVAQAGMSNEMRAESLFRSGEKKFDSGQYAEACNDFTESLRLGPKLGTLLNLALCHETIGKTATAWAEFHHGAAWAAQNGQRDRHDFAMQHVQALELKLPRVLLQLPADRAIETVDVDGEPLADSRWYLPVFLDPGEHSVTIGSPGKKRGTVKFRVINSPTEQLVNVPPLSDDPVALPPKPKAVDPDPDAKKRLVGIVLLAAGGAGVALGGTFGVLAVGQRDAIEGRCSGHLCTEAGASAYRDAQTYATVSTVSTLLGVGAAAAGAWLVLTSKRATPVTQVGLVPRAGGAELGVGGVF